MQLKRVFVSLLVAIMMLSLAVITATAADTASTTFDIALETSVSNVDADGNVLVNPGDTLEINVVIKNNPGVATLQLDLAYNPDQLAPVVNTDGDIEFEGDIYNFTNVFENNGMISAVTNISTVNVDKTGVLFTMSFVVAEEFTGEVELSATVLTYAGTYDEVVNNTADAPVVVTFSSSECNFDYENPITEEADCLNDGRIYVKCTDEGCEEIEVLEVLPALDHDLKEMEAQAPTCTEDGTTAGVTCQREGCDYTTVEVDPATDHTEAEEAVIENVEAPNCVEAGSHDEVIYCTVCNEELKRETVVDEALGHTAEFVAGKAPTCTETGLTAGMKCTVCGEFTVEQKEIAALGHTFGEYTSNDDATCTANATETAKCVRCDVTDTRIVADTILDHTAGKVVVENKKEATCTANGSYENVVYCTVCKAELSRKTVVTEMIPHTVVEAEAQAPTCTTPGFTSGGVCSVCNAVVDATEYIAPLEHTPVAVPGVEATCTSIGLTEGSKCSVCNTVLKAQEIIPVKAHTVKALAAVEATCTSTGLTAGEICEVCNTVLKAQEVVAVKAHTVKALAAVEATCTSTGLTAGEICEVCNTVLKAQEVVAVKAHTVKALAAVEATCTSTGLTAGEICEVCNTVLKAQEVVAVKAHTEKEIAAVEATCTSAGATAGKICEVCNTVLEAPVVVEKLAHTSKTLAAVEATCTSSGLTAGEICEVCNTLLKAQELVPVAAHTEETIAAVAATCTTAGSTEGKKCSVCGVVTVAPKVVDPTGHTEEVIPAVEATKKADGLTEGKKCTTCGEITDAQGVIPMLPTSLAWLWVLIAAIVVIGALVVVYFVVLRKKK